MTGKDPRCSLTTGTHQLSPGRHVSDVAAEGMRKHAEYKARIRAAEEAKARSHEMDRANKAEFLARLRGE